MEQQKQNNACKAMNAHTLMTLRRISMIVLAVILAGSIVLCAVSVRNSVLRSKINLAYSGRQQTESVYPLELDAAQEKEKVRQTHRHGQIGKFRYICNNSILFDEPGGFGAILFGNVSSNDCTLVFSIIDDQGVLLYRSAGVAPGKYVSLIRLLHAASVGTYHCRLYVAAYALDTNNFVGVQYSKLTVQIGG